MNEKQKAFAVDYDYNVGSLTLSVSGFLGFKL